MVIKCDTNPIYYNSYYAPQRTRDLVFRGYQSVLKEAEKSADTFVRGPVAEKIATGLRGFGTKKFLEPIRAYLKNYVNNIRHTYEHKVVFAMIEKELFGKRSIDSITHDLDKLILYILGFPKSFVSEFHRKHSEHHIESGKKMNLRSMLCDNVASSPEFKPEKKYSLREYYAQTEELQGVEGLEEIMEMYNYGEDIDFSKIKREKHRKHNSAIRLIANTVKLFPLLFTKFI